MNTIPTSEQIKKKKINDFILEQRHYLLTSRFNNETWNENHEYRMRHKTIGCIYCTPERISQAIPLDAIIFILEMNNDTNKIIGVGMVRNRPICDKYYVYKEGNYNRFVYVGKTRISRDEMTEEEEEIMKLFDILCFKGNKHMKRGHGLKSFPIEILYKCSKKLNLVNFISEMFKKRLIQKAEKNINEIIG
jgi:hypothetical protein